MDLDLYGLDFVIWIFCPPLIKIITLLKFSTETYLEDKFFLHHINFNLHHINFLNFQNYTYSKLKNSK